MVPTAARLSLVVAVVALVAGCAQQPAPDATTTPATTTPGMDMDEPMAATVEVGEPGAGAPPSLYYIKPASLALMVGMPVNLTFMNAGQISHDLVIKGIEDGADVKVDSTDAGASKVVEFTPSVAGEYEMYCTLGASPLDHKGNGMSGKVVVS